MNAQRKLRRGAALDNEQDATKLQLGAEFDHAQSLTMAEAKLIIEAVRDARRHELAGEEPVSTESVPYLPYTDYSVLRKALDYMESFNRFSTNDSAQAVERLLSQYEGLHKFERAQLGTLCPEDPEEAKTLIPSLAEKIDDEDLGALLEDLTSLRTRR